MQATRYRRVLLLLLGAAFALCGALPARAQTSADVDETLTAIVRVKAKIVRGARSAATLGQERDGTGVLVREGYIVTIGYLVVESESIEVTGADGRTVPAALAGYDHASGFGLIKLLAPLAGKPIALGDSAALKVREPVLAAGWGGRENASVVYVASRRGFSGSWEYLLESAIFTVPAIDNWSGAALVSAKGELVGIGSLIVADAAGERTQEPGNMFVPIDLLKPILGDLIAHGRRPGPSRPWLGLNAEDVHGRVFVVRVSPEGPADSAGVRSGDIVLGVGGEEVSSLGDFYRKLWARGAAGTEVRLSVLQGAKVKELNLRSIDRTEYFRSRPNY